MSFRSGWTRYENSFAFFLCQQFPNSVVFFFFVSIYFAGKCWRFMLKTLRTNASYFLNSFQSQYSSTYVRGEGPFPVLHVHGVKTWHFFCKRFKTLGVCAITFIFTAWFLCLLSEIDRSCSGHCCAFQILCFHKSRKITLERKSDEVIEKGSQVELCGLALIRGGGARPLVLE